MTEEEAQRIRDDAIAKVHHRLQTILDSPDGLVMLPLVRHLAFQTDLPAPEALEILASTRSAVDEQKKVSTAAQQKQIWAQANVPVVTSIHVH